MITQTEITYLEDFVLKNIVTVDNQRTSEKVYILVSNNGEVGILNCNGLNVHETILKTEKEPLRDDNDLDNIYSLVGRIAGIIKSFELDYAECNDGNAEADLIIKTVEKLNSSLPSYKSDKTSKFFWNSYEEKWECSSDLRFLVFEYGLDLFVTNRSEND